MGFFKESGRSPPDLGITDLGAAFLSEIFPRQRSRLFGVALVPQLFEQGLEGHVVDLRVGKPKLIGKRFKFFPVIGRDRHAGWGAGLIRLISIPSRFVFSWFSTGFFHVCSYICRESL